MSEIFHDPILSQEGKENEELSTPEQVIDLMSGSQSEQEWNNNCDKVKAAFKGYPDWWYEKIILSGVLAQTQQNWEK